MDEKLHLPFRKKDDHSITKNYCDITHPALVSMVSDASSLYRIRTEDEKIIGKNQNGFGRNRFSSQILTIRRIIQIVQKYRGNTFLLKFLQGIWFYSLERWNKYFEYMIFAKKLSPLE